jgi:excisionase family DNA binding protein
MTADNATEREQLADFELLTLTEAASRLGTTHRFVRRLVAERRIAYLKIGRHVRISTEDLDAFVAAARVEPRSATTRR